MAAIKIDKSRFSPEELAQYEALLAKATVDEEAEGAEEEDLPPMPPRRKEEAPEDEAGLSKETRKSAEPDQDRPDPMLTKALEDLEALKKSGELRELAEVAKKYAPLGKNEKELAETLYAMKSASPANYEAYLQVLDEHLDLVNKSGLFSEIGKSGSQGGGTVEDRIEAAASDIQKSDPSLTRAQAVVKAWDAHPDLLAEYERSYRQ